MLPSFCFATFQQHLNADRAVRCLANATKLLTLRSFARSVVGRSHFRPFRHFSRNFNVQRESSVIDLFFRARAYTHTYILAIYDNGHGVCTCTAFELVADTHMFAVASRDVCPFTYPRVCLYPSFFSRTAAQQPADLNVKHAKDQYPKFISSLFRLKLYFSF